MRGRRVASPVLLAAARFRSDLPLAAAIFGVVLVTAFVFAAVPHTFARNADRGVEFAVEHANPYARNVEVMRAGRIEPGETDPLAGVEAAGRQLEHSFPESLRGLIQDSRNSVETVRYSVVDAPGVPGPAGTTRLLTLKLAEGAEDRIRVVDGRLPSTGEPSIDLPFRGEQDDAPLVELAVSREAAAQLSVRVEDRLYLAPDSEDPLAEEVPLSERSMLVAEVTGLFEPRGADDRALLEDARLDRAVTRDTDTRRFVYGYGLVSGDAYAEVARATAPLPLRYSWRYDVHAGGFDASDFDRLDADVRALDAQFGESTFGQRLGTGVRTGLAEVLAGYRRDRDASVAVLAVGAGGLLSVALALLALLAVLAAERRSEGIELVRSRGGALWQVLGAAGVEGLAVALPAGVLGYAAAALALGGGAKGLSAWLVGAIVAATGVVLAGAAFGPAKRLASRGRAEVGAPVLTPRRLALEGLVVALALLGAYLLRRRGLAESGQGFDPYLAAVPPLIALAVGILAVRLYPLAVRLVADVAGRRRDLVPALAFRRVARQPEATGAPLLVLIVGISVAVFSAAVAATLADAQGDAEPGALSPLATGTLDAFRVGAVLAGLYTCFVLVLAPLLTARSRVRDLSYLRALGMSEPQASKTVAAELGPLVAAAFVIGSVLGVVLLFVVQPGLDFSLLSADGREPGMRVDPFLPALLLVALVTVFFAAVRLTSAVMRRTSISRALRMGDR
jgi:putative ABC transport system permease protein